MPGEKLDPGVEDHHLQGDWTIHEWCWDPELAETLYQLLYLSDRGDRELDSELKKLEQTHQGAVYSQLIHLLSHLSFEPSEAKRHWQRILDHCASMEKRLASPVDLRVALVSYFVQVNRKLKNPKIIELKLFEQTRASAYRDELTGLQNYRSFGECLAREILMCERHDTPLSLVMIDIDDFKNYNDDNGHEAGNGALAAIAGILNESLRKVDVAARYGGEEFALILPMTPKVGARQVAERARAMVEQNAFPGERTQPGGTLTVSMGIATLPADAEEASELVRRAMYFAKTNGKNQVQLYEQNRRSHQRIHTSLEGAFCVLTGEYRSMTTMDISEGGLRFFADREISAGSLVEIRLRLPGSDHEIDTSGRVVHVKKKSGKFETAVRFIDVKKVDRILLARYIRGRGPGEGL